MDDYIRRSPVFHGLLLVAVGICTLDLGARQLSAQKEDGFAWLFDGKTLHGWRNYGKTGTPTGWKVEGGTLFRESGGGDLISERQFGDFDLRFDWKVGPGANSGVMYRVHEGKEPAYFTGPEYQILDDAAHHDGGDPVTSAAALYGLYAPAEQVVRPAGEWNSARIVLRRGHIQHWLNDVLVVNCKLGSADWDERYQGSKFKDWKDFGRMEKGHIVLQDHGDPVWFRNIRIMELHR